MSNSLNIDIMKGIYLQLWRKVDEIEGDKTDGIAQKILSQVKAFEDAGMEVELLYLSPVRESFWEKLVERFPMPLLRPELPLIERMASCDFLYIRNHMLMSGYLYLAIKQTKRLNPGIKIILEIPTFPYKGEMKLNLSQKPLQFNDWRYRRQLHRFVDRIATYSKDDAIWGIPTIRFSNAIDFKRCKRRHVMESLPVGKPLEIVACAQLAFWHGYDRAIRGLADYYSGKERKYDIILHLVGDGKCLNEYKEIAKQLSVDEKIIFHGRLSGEDLDAIYDRCIIGLDSMGRHRSKVYYNSSLKGKEYLAKGLIVVSGVETEMDSDKEYKYYCVFLLMRAMSILWAYWDFLIENWKRNHWEIYNVQ